MVVFKKDGAEPVLSAYQGIEGRLSGIFATISNIIACKSYHRWKRLTDESTNLLNLRFDRRVRLEFRDAAITSDAGFLAARELDQARGLTELSTGHLKDSRTGRNVQHLLAPLLRQPVYSRLAGFEDTNDAERLVQDPAMEGGDKVEWHRGELLPRVGFIATTMSARPEGEIAPQDRGDDG
jgi:hypothetical protein